MSENTWRQGLAGYVLCISAGLGLFAFGVFDKFDLLLLDLGFSLERSYFPQPANNDIVIVAVDEDFLRQAPEPFALLHAPLAQLFSAVAAAKPRVVGLDIVLPSRSYSFLVPKDSTDFDFDAELTKGLLKLGAASPLVVGEAWDSAHEQFVKIYPAFLGAASLWVQKRGPAGFQPIGSSLVCQDPDDVIREYPGPRCPRGTANSTFSSQLAALLDRRRAWSGYINYGIGGVFTFTKGQDLIAWHKAGDATKLGQLQDKVVLIGVVLDGDDRHNAPIEMTLEQPPKKKVPGVTIQAQILRSMLNQGLVEPAPQVLILLLIVLSGAFFFGERLRIKTVLFVTFIVTVLGLSLALLRGTMFLPPLAILGTATLAMTASGIVVGRRHWLTRQNLTRTFSGYVSPLVLSGILSGAVSPGRKGERRSLCVLFSDIRGFTRLSENLPPDDVLALLNKYFSRMTRIVHNHGGSVDKFIGDGMMALFGAPQALECPEKNALEAAHEMLLALLELNKEYKTMGLPEIRIGVGLHSGDVVIGHVGSAERHEYTAIGDTVNVAARVCDLPKALKVPIVCTEPVAEALGWPGILVDMGTRPIKGHSDIRVFGWDPQISEVASE